MNNGLLSYKWIKKDAGSLIKKDEGNVMVPWTITINEGALFDVKGMTLKDRLDDDSVLSYDLTQGITVLKNGTGFLSIPADEIMIDADGKGWSYTIPNEDAWENAAYTFTYHTTYNENSFIGEKKMYYNTAHYGPYGTKSGVELGGIQATIKKEVVSYTYDTTTWKSVLKIPKEGINTANSLTDGLISYFSDALDQNIAEQNIIEESITVNSTAPIGYSINVGENNELVEIYFGDDTDSIINKDTSYFPTHSTPYEVSIEFTTKTPLTSDVMKQEFSESVGEKLVNVSKLHVGNSLNAHASAHRDIEKAFHKTAETNSFSGEATYSVIVSKRVLEEGNTTLSIDDICSDNQEFIPNSANLYKSKTKTDFKEDTDSIMMDVNPENPQKTNFMISNIDMDNSEVNYYKITYKTKIVDPNLSSEQGKIEIRNTISSDYPDDPTRFRDEYATNYNNLLINKLVTQVPSKDNAFNVTYEIGINPLALDIVSGDLIFYDTMSDSLIMNYESIEIIDKTDPNNGVPLSRDKYTVSKDGESTMFKIDASVANNRYYVVKYRCKIIGNLNSNVNYGNKVELPFGSNTTSSQNENVILSEQSHGDSSLLTYEFSIKKVAEDNLLKGLEGAEFRLYTQEYNPLDQSKNLIATIVTNQDGIATFVDVDRKYMHTGEKIIVVESKAPEGCLLNTSPREIQFDDDYPGKTILDGIEVVEYAGTITFENDLIQNNLSFEKIFMKNGIKQTDEYLSATFGLFKVGEGTPSYTVSSIKGMVEFNDLDIGNYHLKEIDTSSGYSKSDLVYSVEVKAQQDNIIILIHDFMGNPVHDLKYTNKYNLGSIEFIKYGMENSEKQTLANAEFSLIDLANNKEYTAISNEFGSVSFDKLDQGRYLLKESKAPINYVKSDVTLELIVNSAGEIIEADTMRPLDAVAISNAFINTRITNDFSFIKTDSTGSITLKDAVFTLTATDNSNIYTSKSNTDGEVSFENIVSGDYVLEESVAPKGYDKSLNKVKVTIDSENGEVSYDVQDISETFKNNRIQRSFSFIKTDKETHTPLSNATFVMKQGDEEKYKCTSNENGLVEFKDVKPGSYILQEKDQPLGYHLNDAVVLVDIDAITGDITYTKNGNKISDEDLNSIFANTSIKSSFSFVKYNEDLTKTLKDAIFELQDKHSDAVYKASSDEVGRVSFDNIPAGTYLLREIDAPRLYVKGDIEIMVDIDKKTGAIRYYDDASAFIQLHELSNLMKNKAALTTSLVIHKVDTDKQPLTGANFKLEHYFRGNWIEVESKNDDSEFVFNELVAGEYRLTETKAPLGYAKVDPIHIEVKEDMNIYANGNHIEKLEVVNHKTYIDVDTSDTNNILMLITYMSLSLLILSYIYYRRKSTTKTH